MLPVPLNIHVSFFLSHLQFPLLALTGSKDTVDARFPLDEAQVEARPGMRALVVKTNTPGSEKSQPPGG